MALPQGGAFDFERKPLDRADGPLAFAGRGSTIASSRPLLRTVSTA